MQGYFSKWISLAGGGRSTGPGWEPGLTVVSLDDQPPGLITVPRETQNSGKVLGPWQAVLSIQTARGPKRRVRKQRLGLGLKGITTAVRGQQWVPNCKDGRAEVREGRGQTRLRVLSPPFPLFHFPFKGSFSACIKKNKTITACNHFSKDRH